MMVRRLWVGAVLLTIGGNVVPDDEAPRYTGALLACVAFAEDVRTTAESRSPAGRVQQQAGRVGQVIVRGADSGRGLRLEAWYDSLAIWREAGGEIERPDTDGFVGGRFEGSLTPDGRYLAAAVPFVPAFLAEHAKLGAIMDDFLPRLPDASLGIGRSWADSAGLEIRRLPDRREGGEARQRFEWTKSTKARDSMPGQDSTIVMVEQEIRETGELEWSPRLGPMTWSRRIVIEATIPGRLGVRRTAASTITQEIRVMRRAAHPECSRRP